jgi:hypothetical protein
MTPQRWFLPKENKTKKERKRRTRGSCVDAIMGAHIIRKLK